MEETEVMQKAMGDTLEQELTIAELGKFKEDLKKICQDGEATVARRKDVAQKTRFCIWAGQSDDGRKHRAQMSGKEPFPFEGASDGRIRTADMIINEHVLVLTAAAMRANIQVQGMESSDMAKAKKVKTFLKWLVFNKWKSDYLKEITKVAQWQEGDSPAAAVMSCLWEEEWALRKTTVTTGEIAAYVKQMIESSGEAMTPEDMQETESVLTDPLREPDGITMLRQLIPTLKEKSARKMLRTLRETGQADFPERYLRRNEPKIRAERLFETWFVPLNTLNFKTARVHYRRQMLTMAEVESAALAGEWDPEFVDELLGEGRGQRSEVRGQKAGHGGESVLTLTAQQRTDTGAVPVRDQSEDTDLYEIITAFYMATDEIGVMGVYMLVFHVNINIPATPRMLLDYPHGEYPAVYFPREILSNEILDSRSVAEIALTDQATEKLHHDLANDYAQVATLPPVFTPANRPKVPLVIHALAEIPRRKRDDYEFMNPPPYPAGNEKVMIETRRRRNEYWARPSADTPESLAILANQGRVNLFLEGMAEVLSQALQLSQKYMTDEEIQRVTGSKGEPLFSSKKEIAGEYDVALYFDAQDLDKEFLKTLAEVLGKWIVPMDTSQVILRDRLVKRLLAAYDPNLAEDTTREVEEAQKAEVDDEDLRFMKIATGIQPDPLEKANFRMRLQRLEQLRDMNPETTDKLTEVSKKLLEAEVKNLQFGITQEENAMIGRVGVKPVFAGTPGKPVLPEAGA